MCRRIYAKSFNRDRVSGVTRDATVCESACHDQIAKDILFSSEKPTKQNKPAHMSGGYFRPPRPWQKPWPVFVFCRIDARFCRTEHSLVYRLIERRMPFLCKENTWSTCDVELSLQCGRYAKHGDVPSNEWRTAQTPRLPCSSYSLNKPRFNSKIPELK